jgi:hypothetical protein
MVVMDNLNIHPSNEGIIAIHLHVNKPRYMDLNMAYFMMLIINLPTLIGLMAHPANCKISINLRLMTASIYCSILFPILWSLRYILVII